MTVTPDFRCNNACRFCEVEGRLSTPVEPSAAIAKAAEAGARELIFTGGEVTLHRELPDWVAQAVSAGIPRVVVRTNGRMLAYKAFADGLAQSGVHRVEVALHGPRAEVHDWTTRVPGSFEQAIKGLRRARKRGIDVAVNTVLTRSTYRHLAEMVPLLARLEVRDWVLHELRPLGAAVTNAPELQAPWAMMATFIRQAARLAAPERIALSVMRAPQHESAQQQAAT